MTKEEENEIRVFIDWLMLDPQMSASNASTISLLVRKPKDKERLISWIENHPLARPEEIMTRAWEIQAGVEENAD